LIETIKLGGMQNQDALSALKFAKKALYGLALGFEAIESEKIATNVYTCHRTTPALSATTAT